MEAHEDHGLKPQLHNVKTKWTCKSTEKKVSKIGKKSEHSSVMSNQMNKENQSQLGSFKG